MSLLGSPHRERQVPRASDADSIAKFMRLYQFSFRVVVASELDESELFERMRHFAVALSGDPLDHPSVRRQAKAALTIVTSAGEDSIEPLAWHEEACRRIGKAHVADCFENPTSKDGGGTS